MRLWHKDLIPVLPDKQLIGQYRELCAIAKNIAETGSPNHLLVNKIMNYPMIHFVYYTDLVLNELSRRNVNISKSYRVLCDNCAKAKDKFIDSFNDKIIITSVSDIYADWMNYRYFFQCYKNLEEKYDCGVITEKEWDKIYDCFNRKVLV